MRNYEFFGAPVGMIFTLDEDLEIGSWLDLGIYLGASWSPRAATDSTPARRRRSPISTR